MELHLVGFVRVFVLVLFLGSSDENEGTQEQRYEREEGGCITGSQTGRGEECPKRL